MSFTYAQKIEDLASKTFSSEWTVRTWLNTPLRGFKNETPLKLATNQENLEILAKILRNVR